MVTREGCILLVLVMAASSGGGSTGLSLLGNDVLFKVDGWRPYRSSSLTGESEKHAIAQLAATLLGIGVIIGLQFAQCCYRLLGLQACICRVSAALLY